MCPGWWHIRTCELNILSGVELQAKLTSGVGSFVENVYSSELKIKETVDHLKKELNGQLLLLSTTEAG